MAKVPGTNLAFAHVVANTAVQFHAREVSQLKAIFVFVLLWNESKVQSNVKVSHSSRAHAEFSLTMSSSKTLEIH